MNDARTPTNTTPRRPRPTATGALVRGAVAIVVCVAGASSRAAAVDVSDAAVEARIAELRQELANTQLAEGSWHYSSNKNQNLGMTALAILALKHAGVGNDDPTIVKGVEFILNNKSQYVYAEGLVACALELVAAKVCRPRMRSAFTFLLGAQTTGGNWGYGPAGRSYDNSNSQFAILGLAAAHRSGFPDTPRDTARFARVKEKAIAHWKNSQCPDGGWAYRHGMARSTLSMTCAGIASLSLLGERLAEPGGRCGQYKYNTVMQKGLAALAGMLQGGRGASGGYAMYALERVGVLLDIKLIGDYDWYRSGATAILSGRGGGGHGGQTSTAFQLLFLAKGKAPVAIAKWKWNGDWNNDRNDVRAWVDHAGTEFGMRLDRWTSDLEESNSPAAVASMVFVNGHGRFDATDRQLAFIRRFLLSGGTVVGEACCGREEFAESFALVMRKKLFPGQPARFRPITNLHPVCAAKHGLTPEDVGGLEFCVSCRKLKMLLLTRDISCPLEGEKGTERDLPRARKVATNILAWAMRSRRPGGKLSRPELAETVERKDLTLDQLVREKADRGRAARLAFGRLVHRGDWDADPQFFPALKAALGKQRTIPQFEKELPVVPTSGDLFHVPFIFANGHEDPALRQNEYLHLRTWIQNGGFLLCGACCSSESFTAGARELIARILPNDKLERIGPDDPIWREPFDCRARAVGTPAYHKRFGASWAPLFGVRREGRWAVILSPVDLCCDLQGDLAEDIVGYRRASSVKLIGNIIRCALAP